MAVRPSGYQGKRLVDLAIAVFVLLLAAPVYIVIATLVRLRLGRPVLFHQVRPGLCGKPFTMYKFRTMTDMRDAQGDLLPDEVRLTQFGSFLRSTSLDELPEIFNVVKGEMSIVGPRPLLTEYLELYSPVQARRHEVRPGMTGWAQVNGRNTMSWEAKFEHDIWYVDHQSLRLDLRILVQTFVKLLTREGINQPGQVTAAPFRGPFNNH